MPDSYTLRTMPHADLLFKNLSVINALHVSGNRISPADRRLLATLVQINGELLRRFSQSRAIVAELTAELDSQDERLEVLS